MSIYKIFENDMPINRIIADENFCMEYCAEMGYTYELEGPEPTEVKEDPPKSDDIMDRLAAAYLEGVADA